jgi:hypothetical protein
MNSTAGQAQQQGWFPTCCFLVLHGIALAKTEQREYAVSLEKRKQKWMVLHCNRERSGLSALFLKLVLIQWRNDR